MFSFFRGKLSSFILLFKHSLAVKGATSLFLHAIKEIKWAGREIPHYIILRSVGNTKGHVIKWASTV